MDPKIIDKVLSKTATPDEARQVAVWFASDEGQEYFSQRYDRELYLFDEKILEESFDDEITSKRMKVRFFSQIKMRVRAFRFTAASVIIPFILLASAFTFVANRSGIFQSEEMAEFIVPYGEQLYVVLQDGTQVQLNSGSCLQYPKTFGFFKRKVKLSGEAYFSVAKESTRPFEVDLKDITVRVTGTKFNVKAYSDDNIIRVALEEGSVYLTDKLNETYPMKLGESAKYDKAAGTCKISEASDMSLYTAWRTKSLNFYRTPLKDIIKTLERQYEVQFNVSDSALLEYRFSISTSKININEVLNDLEKVSKVQFKLNKDRKYAITSMN